MPPECDRGASGSGGGRRGSDTLADLEQPHRRGVGALLVLALGGALAATAVALPRENAPLPAIAREAMTVALPDWHTLEPVNEVVYGTRGFDTFGETFLLLAAVIGIGLLARRRERRSQFVGEEIAASREEPPAPRSAHTGRTEETARVAESEEQGRGRRRTPDSEPLGARSPEDAEGMTVVVRGGIRLLAPVLAIAGLYLMAWGYSPGGGFPGGAVLTGVVLLAYVSVGRRRIEKLIKQERIEALELAGALLIVAVEAGGLFFKGSFSANFLPLGQVGTIPSGGVLQAFSASELIEVSTGLTLAIFGLLAMAHDWAPHGDQSSPAARRERGGAETTRGGRQR